jgi:hypothetical protein
LIGLVQLIQDPKTGVTGIGRNLILNIQTAVIKKILHKPDRLQMGRREFIHVHRLLVEIARMEKFDAEGEIFHPPQGLVAAEPDLPVFVVIQVVLAQDGRQVGARRVKGMARPLLGTLDDIIQVDVTGLRTGRHPAGQDHCYRHNQATSSPHSG